MLWLKTEGIYRLKESVEWNLNFYYINKNMFYESFISNMYKFMNSSED